MEETQTLVKTRDDVREYLDSHTEESCSLTWQTIEAFNSILASFGSQDTPDIVTLDTLLDSFHHLATNNKEKSVWSDFGFELGVICVKILSAIERTDMFEDLFLKLLSVISTICEYNSDVWKAVARQILNVLINKKFSYVYMEKVVRVYVSVLRKIEGVALNSFACQNLNLLKSLSMMVRGLGDFETQVDFMELVFLHVSDKKLAEGFFHEAKGRVRDLFRRLQFMDFEADCRLYLNALNKEGSEKRVLSICCNVLYLGGCFMEPPSERKGIWLDANKTSDRLSLKCSDFAQERVFYILFSDLVDVRLEKETNGSYCVTIKTKNLNRVHKDAKNDDVLCVVVDNTREGILEFVEFLQERIQRQKKKLKKLGGKLSQTCDDIFIDRIAIQLNEGILKREVQDNAISSSVANREKPGVGRRPLSLLKTNLKPENENRDAWEVLIKLPENISPIKAEPSQNSFVESLNKNLGLDSPGHSFEDSINTIEFGKTSATTNHKLFREPIFNFLEKENEPPEKTQARDPTPIKRVLRERKVLESQSEDYFRRPNSNRRKPVLPKLKKTSTRKKKDTEPKKKTTEPPGNKSKQPQPRPSLLDPNGYAYQRWLQPTTTKRSNFWLEKLNALQKPKLESGHVFDFSEEERTEERKPKNLRGITKPKKKKKEPRSTMKEMKNILKTFDWKTVPKKTREKKVSSIDPRENDEKDFLDEFNTNERKPENSRGITKPTTKQPEKNQKATKEIMKTREQKMKASNSRVNEDVEKIPSQVFDFLNESEEKKPKNLRGITKSTRKYIGKSETMMKEVKEILKTSDRGQKMKASAINPQGNEENIEKVLEQSTRDFSPAHVFDFADEPEVRKNSDRIIGLRKKEKEPEKNHKKMKEILKTRGEKMKVSTINPRGNEEEIEKVLEQSIRDFSQGSGHAFDVSEERKQKNSTEIMKLRREEPKKKQKEVKEIPKTRGQKLKASTINLRKNEEEIGKVLEQSIRDFSPDSGRVLDFPDESKERKPENFREKSRREEKSQKEILKTRGQKMKASNPQGNTEMDKVSGKSIRDFSPGSKHMFNFLYESDTKKRKPRKQKKEHEERKTKEIVKTWGGMQKMKANNSRGNEETEKVPEESVRDFPPEVELQINEEAIHTKPTEEDSEEDELVLTSDDESPEMKKRERSEEENSLTKTFVKKKPKTFKLSTRRSFPSVLTTRFQQTEEKDKQQTQEIVEAARKATNHLLDHLRQREAQKMVTYLKTAEEVGVRLREMNDMETRAKRIQRVVAYYETGCSVNQVCKSVDAQLSKVRDAVKDLKKIPLDSTEKVKRMNDRLKNLIGSEIDRSIKNELKSRQDRLIQYLKSGFGEFVP